MKRRLQHSEKTADKIYCVYVAGSEEMVREHARQVGFPANRASEVKLMIDPTSGEACYLGLVRDALFPGCPQSGRNPETVLNCSAT